MNYLYRVIIFLIIFTLFSCSASAIEEVILNENSDNTLNVENKGHVLNKGKEKFKNRERGTFDFLDNIEYEDTLFENFKNPLNRHDDTYTLFEKILDTEIKRTDVPSFLLKEQMTFDYDKGIVDKMQVYGAYNSALAMGWTGSDYDSNYDFNFGQIGVLGKFTDGHTQFKLLVNPYNSSENNYMQNFIADAYIVNDRIPHHKIIAGVSRNQIGVEGGQSSFTLPFANRAQISRNFGNVRAMGIRLAGDYKLTDYSLAFNSSDRFFHSFFPGVEFTGWINFKPLGKTDGRYGKLVLGTGLNAGRNHNDYTVGGAYAAYYYKNFMANFECAIADGSNGRYVNTNKQSGFYTTIGYKITPKLEILARYDEFDPDRNIANNNRREWTAGINYYLKGQALRLILNYVFCDNDNMPDSNRIFIGTQVIL